MSGNHIRQVLGDIMDELIPMEIEGGMESKLAWIGDNSLLAAAFLVAIEEEWEVEMEDDHINASFFTDTDYLVAVIESSIAHR